MLFRNKKTLKIWAISTVVLMIGELFYPYQAMALTGGPSQPEVQSFTPVGTSEMVDIFSGDFNYNIPLMDVGGYPINLSYNANVTMDQESSMVGLGWNVNIGSITRSVRGLPDDFKGDEVTKQFNLKPNRTYGASSSAGLQIFGFDKNGLKNQGVAGSLNFGVGVSFNNYTGYGFDINARPSLQIGKGSKSTLTAGLGLSASSERGVGVAPDIGLSVDATQKVKNDVGVRGSLGLAVGLPFNSRAGLTSLTVKTNASLTATKINRNNPALGLTEGVNATSNITFATPTYTPTITIPTTTTGISFTATVGGEAFGLHGNVSLGGYGSIQRLIANEERLRSYGYFYAHESEALANGTALLDFNREKDGNFTKNTPNLPLAQLTYDIYNVTGQGVGGMYRLYRSEAGTVYDNTREITGGSDKQIGVEIGGGNAVHGGANFTTIKTDIRTGKWVADNNAQEFISFKDNKQGFIGYEPAYFKQAGEKTPFGDNNYFEGIGGAAAVQLGLGSADPGTVTSNLIDENGRSMTMSLDKTSRGTRQPRNQAFSALNGRDAQQYALEEIYSYNGFTLDEGGYTDRTAISRVDARRKEHHLSEMTIIRPDGARYVYGLPVYNHEQQEVTFAVDPSNASNCNTGLVNYNPAIASSANNKGLDNYFEKVVTPAYATAYMLTAIVSPDYTDLTGDGPSDDDNGTYTKFNYRKTTDNYQWRIPFQQNQANFNVGLQSDGQDNKASYLYGNKELWYIHSIETKTHVAEFYMSERQDGFGVRGEHGGAGTETMQKLDRIVLYAKPDRELNSNADLEPIKTVHFEYDYSLCPGVPNNPTGSGKLTLRSVFFTYGNSFKGKFSPYRFDYNDFNPAYNLKGYDRWGNYMENIVGTNACSIDDKSTAEFPYTIQNDRETADRYAQAWTLKQINLPSGGKITVDLEADDYAYVQDQSAMQMFEVTGVGNSENQNPVNTNTLAGNRYVYFELEDPIPSDASGVDERIRRSYLKNTEQTQLFFRFFIDIGGGTQQNQFNYVPGYVEVEDAGAVKQPSGGFYTHGFVKLKGTGLNPDDNSGDINPIRKIAWQFARLYQPKLVYGGPTEPAEDQNLLDIFKAIVSTGGQIAQLFKGLHQTLNSKGHANNFISAKSTIRLYSADSEKVGGGHRVKRIALSDEWDALSNSGSSTSAAYGQEYSYDKTVINEFGNEEIISSGVAAYEPMLGGEENPLRQPVPFSVDKVLAPSDKLYLEEPFGEMFYPGAQVGYSEVTVRNLQYDEVKRNATGYVKHEFYTAQDFPVVTRQTRLNARHHNPRALISLLKSDVQELMTVSQGYVIEVNDMHGKPKAQWVYPEDKPEPISGVEYFYKTNGTASQTLSNEVNTIYKTPLTNGDFIREDLVGVDIDIIHDLRENENVTETLEIGANVDAFVAGIFPIIVPTSIPVKDKEKVRFRSAVTTKVVRRYGIMETVRAYDLGSSVETKNLLWDAETGEVLLTETQNQFGDPVYSFTYPAHWGYEGMASAYKNLGLRASLGNSQIVNYLIPGDRVIAKTGTAEEVGYVAAVNGNSVILENKLGEIISAAEVQVLRPGRRNQQSTAIGTVTSLASPLRDTNGDGKPERLSFENIEVLNAGAVEFSDQWQRFCNCGFDPDEAVSDWAVGVRGNWRAKRSYLYLTDRSQTRFNDNPSVREDGSFEQFNPFWTPATQVEQDWIQNTDRWTFTTQVTVFSPNGYELENQDALGRYSAAVYGYNQSLPVSVSNNAQYKETAFDNFEDYDFGDCADDHFSYKIFKDNVTETEAHSGRRSIRVAPGSSLEVEKIIVDCPTDENSEDE